MELTEEKKNLNFSLWIQKLKDYGCYSETLVADMQEKLKNATFGSNLANGGCYDGSLIDVVLNNLCTIGIHINELAFGMNAKNKNNHQFLKVNKEMLMRVLLLQHIGKAEMFMPQANGWKKQNGYLYEFNSNLAAQMKLGERSAFLCMKYGIKLSEEEFEAMTIIDKKEETFNSHRNPLAELVLIVNQLTQIELQRKYDYYNTEKQINV